MNVINACNQMIAPNLGIVAIAKSPKTPNKIRMHPAQVCALSSLYISVAVENVSEVHSLEDIDAVRHLAKDYLPHTFMGIPIEQDPEMEISWMDFLADGEVVSRIQSLAIPIGFEVSR
jgi:hypothetical protein